MVAPAGYGEGAFMQGLPGDPSQDPGFRQWWLQQVAQAGKQGVGKPGSIGPEQGAMVQPGMLPPKQTAGIQLPMSGGGSTTLMPNYDAKTGQAIVQEIQTPNRAPMPGDYGQLAMMPDPRAFLQQQIQAKLPIGLAGSPPAVGLMGGPLMAQAAQTAQPQGNPQQAMADVMKQFAPRSEGDVAREQQLKLAQTENQGKTDVASIQAMNALRAVYAQVLTPLFQQGSGQIGPAIRMLNAANGMLGQQHGLPVGVSGSPPQVGVQPPEAGTPPARQKTPQEIELEKAEALSQQTASEDQVANAVAAAFGNAEVRPRQQGPSTITGGHYNPDAVFSALLGSGNVQAQPNAFMTRMLNQQGNPGLEKVLADMQAGTIRRLNEAGKLGWGVQHKMPGGTIVSRVPNPDGKGFSFEIETPGGQKFQRQADTDQAWWQHLSMAPKPQWWKDTVQPTLQNKRDQYLREAHAGESALLEAIRRHSGTGQ